MNKKEKIPRETAAVSAENMCYICIETFVDLKRAMRKTKLNGVPCAWQLRFNRSSVCPGKFADHSPAVLKVKKKNK